MTVEESHRQEHRISVLNDTGYCDSYMLCAVHSLYKMEPEEVKAMLAGIVSKLTWCFAHNKPHFLDHYSMAQAIGSYAPLCEPSTADKERE
jgi:hypothetical protein